MVNLYLFIYLFGDARSLHAFDEVASVNFGFVGIDGAAQLQLIS